MAKYHFFVLFPNFLFFILSDFDFEWPRNQQSKNFHFHTLFQNLSYNFGAKIEISLKWYTLPKRVTARTFFFLYQITVGVSFSNSTFKMCMHSGLTLFHKNRADFCL